MRITISLIFVTALAVAVAAYVVAPRQSMAGSIGGGSIHSDTPSDPGCGEAESCAAVSYEATATSGTGLSCTAALEVCIDLGPGTANHIGTDGSGRIRFGDDTHGPEVWLGGGETRLQPGQVTTGYISLEGGSSGIRQLTTAIVPIEGTTRLVPVALGTCGASSEFGMRGDIAAGASTGARTRLCLCTSDGAGSPVYEWRNIGCPNTSGTTTTCPVCP